MFFRLLAHAIPCTYVVGFLVDALIAYPLAPARFFGSWPTLFPCTYFMGFLVDALITYPIMRSHFTNYGCPVWLNIVEYSLTVILTEGF